ncbi:MAG: RluA family pseudouridine synthase [Candidatus Omnitrophota bacterium]
MQTFTFIVAKEDSGQRLDVFLSKVLPKNTSRTFIQSLIRQGKVTVNHELCKAHKKVKEGDQFKVEFEAASLITVKPQKLPLKIIYEDPDLIVVDKPVGMVVHPAAGNASGTLVNALLYHCKKLSNVNEPLRPGIVHRLDKDTSGVMVVAKNNATHNFLAQQFAEHTISRKYIALVNGNVELDEGIIDLPLGRSRHDREKMTVTFDQSRQAQTVYKVIGRAKSFTTLEILPRTGRTHQIRVHLAYLGHPVLGDAKYGRQASFGRLALHAAVLGFVHPKTGKYMEFSSPLPKEFASHFPNLKKFLRR